MKLNYVKTEEDQALLNEAYNAFVDSLVIETRAFLKRLAWEKMQEEENPDDVLFLARKAKDEIAAINFTKIDESLYITRTSNWDSTTNCIQHKIIVPAFVKIGFVLRDSERFDFSSIHETYKLWNKLTHVMNDLYKAFLLREQIEKENRIAANKLAFDSIFETDGDE